MVCECTYQLVTIFEHAISTTVQHYEFLTFQIYYRKKETGNFKIFIATNSKTKLPFTRNFGNVVNRFMHVGLRVEVEVKL